MERRLVDRRGKIFVHYRSFNRADVGISDFRRALARGALTYWEHRGRSKEGRSSDRPGQRASISRTARKRAFPLIIRSTAACASASGKGSMIGRTPVRAANARASAESAAVPEDQPWIRRLPEISLVSPWESLAVGVHSELDRNVAELALRARPGSLPAPRWCSAPERHQDAAVAEVCSLASWGAASLWTGALFWQKIP